MRLLLLCNERTALKSVRLLLKLKSVVCKGSHFISFRTQSRSAGLKITLNRTACKIQRSSLYRRPPLAFLSLYLLPALHPPLCRFPACRLNPLCPPLPHYHRDGLPCPCCLLLSKRLNEQKCLLPVTPPSPAQARINQRLQSFLLIN